VILNKMNYCTILKITNLHFSNLDYSLLSSFLIGSLIFFSKVPSFIIARKSSSLSTRSCSSSKISAIRD